MADIEESYEIVLLKFVFHKLKDQLTAEGAGGVFFVKQYV